MAIGVVNEYEARNIRFELAWVSFKHSTFLFFDFFCIDESSLENERLLWNPMEQYSNLKPLHWLHPILNKH